MPSSDPKPTARLYGLDFARAFAILGMVLVNYTAITDEGESPEWLLFLLGSIQGRAAAIFVVLAGTGISLLSGRARAEQRADLFREARRTLLKRAGFLLVVGVTLIRRWPPDILHFYAVYLTFSVFFLNASSRTLWSMATAMLFTFVFMFLNFDYNAGWTEEGRYAGLWTPMGMARRVFFNGYYPFFPWIAFLLSGMWLGRQKLDDPKFLKKALWSSLLIALCFQTVSWYLTGLSDFVDIESDIPALNLLSTDPYPPGPFYMITSASIAFVVIVVSLMFTSSHPSNFLTQMCIPTGQLALSIYVAHATLGLAFLDEMYFSYGESATLASTVAVAFCFVSTVFAVIWRRFFERGPIEFVMRKFTGS